jgi:hypothetical protein
MPINPMTGGVDYGGASYDPQNMNAAIGMRAAARADVAPSSGIFDILESTPGATTAALFNARRYARTLEKGGRFDVAAGTTGRKLRRAKKYGAMIGDDLAPREAQQFVGGGRRGPLGAYARRKMAQGKTPLLRASRANNLTANPLAVGRFTSLGALAGDTRIAYTPMQGISGIMDFAMKSNRFKKMAGLPADFNPETEKAFSGGVLGRITAINRVNTLDSIIARPPGPGASKFSQARYRRALEAKGKIASNALKVSNVARPIEAMPSVVKAGTDAAQAALERLVPGGVGPLPPGGSATVLNAQRTATLAAIDVEKTRRMQAAFGHTAKFIGEEMTIGKLSNRFTSWYSGSVNFADAGIRQKATFQHAARAGGLDKTAAKALIDELSGGPTKASKYVGGTIRELRGAGKMSEIGLRAIFSKSATSSGRIAGGKVLASGIFKGAGGLMPGLNVLATGQLIYDLAKGAGKIAVKGVNFAKDAMKSMQGTINKPMFGSGFKDNEVAATSRARGVMAIQNSRLNARSLLGAEASMLAAHYG